MYVKWESVEKIGCTNPQLPLIWKPGKSYTYANYHIVDISMFTIIVFICPNLTQLMFEYEFEFPSMGQEKKIPMGLTAKWKLPGYLRPMCYMSDGAFIAMDLLPDTWNYGLRMSRESRKRFPRHWLQGKPLVIDPGMHYGTCVTHGPWCISGSLTHRGGKTFLAFPAHA